MKLGETLRKLKSASHLLSLVINDEISGQNEADRLTGLYCVKGGVACAIEEMEKRIQEREPRSILLPD